MTIAPAEPTTLWYLALEITERCQFTCPSVCYAESGPSRSHSSMSEENWLRIIDEAVSLGTEEIQLIGGEPTLHPGFDRITQYALAAGLRVRVYTNLFRVRDEHWALFRHPGVRLATTYHSTDAEEHDRLTGRTGSHKATRANIIKAVERGIPLRVAILDAGDGERAARARAEMYALKVTDIHVGEVRAVGNAGPAIPSTSALCGRCGDRRATVLPNGDVSVCEIGRFLTAGNVRRGSLRSVLASDQWAEATASVPRRPDVRACGPDCEPASSDSCAPSKGNPCGPVSFIPAS
ncbi:MULTISPECIES: radical SAM protein [Streptomyces]|jgi:MoaA/NifB/PqqE/SkfB family radical SAM enzyme|uniref:MoaA/NifB/PqqE/SkfB family radical SAM enzyme n=1 Tax=Streptomyces nymphaeiformis TaxID=2663842 RepID=A0A7W7TXA6_9ACTN|nr:radical SAM protein [Streptomyces nymphaeiformis]MBB4981082.1 MoaA/NifB/PqqE/SkfB family radical SAM enzyme [Streptomyces nymphaeiformis]